MKKVKDTNDEYHAHDSISASGLKIIFKKSVYHYLNQETFTSPAMNFGSAVHEALLENNTDNIFTLPELNLRTKIGRQERDMLIKEHKDKIVISQAENENLRKILANYRKNSLAMNILSSLKEREMSYYGSIDNVDCRIRPDGLNHHQIVDIKTCQDPSPRAFKNAIYKYAYHLQGCFYSEALGFDPATFRFIAIANKYPFNIEVYGMSEDMICYGQQAWRSAFEQWKIYVNEYKILGYIWEEINDDGSLIV